MKLSRQIAGFGIALVSLWIAIHPVAAAGAADTVRSFYQSLLYNMQYGPSLGQQGRIARLAPVVPRVFNIS
jgi:hypothetical protein